MDATVQGQFNSVLRRGMQQALKILGWTKDEEVLHISSSKTTIHQEDQARRTMSCKASR